MNRHLFAAFVVSVVSCSFSEEFRGIDFPAGAVSFSDAVISYEPDFGKGAVPTHEDFFDPEQSLSVPDYPIGQDLQPGSVSLGSGGRVTLKFVDNVLTGSGSEKPDLHIFEVGTDVEDTFVEISKEGREWFSVGKVTGSISSIDIDAYGFSETDQFRFVRLTDDSNEGMTTGETVGADIDAVGAISTIAKSDRSSWWILIFVVLLIIISIPVFRCRRQSFQVCLSFASSTVVLAIALLVSWILGFYLSWSWTICLTALSIFVILFSFWLIITVRRLSLPKSLNMCALIGGTIGLLITILIFVSGLF